MTQAYSDVHCYSSAPQASCQYSLSHSISPVILSGHCRQEGKSGQRSFPALLLNPWAT